MKGTEMWLMISSLLVLILISACKHEIIDIPAPAGTDNTGNNGNNGNNGGTPCDPNTVYFETDILPFLNSNCAIPGCHDSQSHEDGVILNSYVNVMNTGEVQPYDLDNDLIEAITESDPDDMMPPPPRAPLTAQQINMIQTWIMQGAQNLTCSNSTCDSTQVSYAGKVMPLINNKCKGCHTGSNPGGGITLNSYATVVASATNGSLMGTILHQSGYSPMPKNTTKLSDCEIGIIRNWIAEGMQNN